MSPPRQAVGSSKVEPCALMERPRRVYQAPRQAGVKVSLHPDGHVSWLRALYQAYL